MRELVYFVAVSLDGRIASPEDAFALEGDHLQMIAAEWADSLPAPALAAFGITPDGSKFDTVLMGWKTYAIGLPALTESYPYLQQIMFSGTRTAADVGRSIRITEQDPLAVVREPKSTDGGDIWLCGGGVLAAALLPEIDRLVLELNPVVLGEGKLAHRFPPDAEHRLLLRRCRGGPPATATLTGALRSGCPCPPDERWPAGPGSPELCRVVGLAGRGRCSGRRGLTEAAPYACASVAVLRPRPVRDGAAWNPWR